MAPFEFGRYSYVPILGVRPAEMQALEESSPSIKDKLLPYIVLQPWTTAKQFDNVITRVEATVGSRAVIVDITDEIFLGNRRPVHDRIDELRDSGSGYKNWIDFLGEHPTYLPSVQLGDPTQLSTQVQNLSVLDRCVVVRLTELMFPYAADIARQFRGIIIHDRILFILDFQRQNRDILLKELIAANTIRSIRAVIPECYVSVSASTFPESFVDLDEQDIFERRLYDQVTVNVGGERFIYCDRASVRAERQGGGGGAPAPRIDNALPTKWQFFREPDEDDREVAYQLAAGRAIASSGWQDLGIWGTEAIKRTADGRENSIISAKLATAARINIHLHTQLGGGAAALEIEWSD